MSKKEIKIHQFNSQVLYENDESSLKIIGIAASQYLILKLY